jgi:diguanylate cyclase (GGDEF)-like protein
MSSMPAPAVDSAHDQRLRVSQAGLALGIYAVFALVQHVEVLLGMVDEAASWRLTAWSLTGGVGFYLLLRCGANLRWRALGRKLPVLQSLWAAVAIAWSYAITGPARGAVLLIMLIVIVFAMFRLPSRRVRQVALTGVVLIGGVMLYKSITDPLRYDPRVEAMHFLFFAIVMAACSELAVRIGRLRQRLEAQRSELGQALDRIQALATRDELTQLLNRRAMLERLQLALRERRSAHARLALALVDLDHFKRINDRHGHAAGDAVLRHFAAVTRQALRADDVVARWGGEEFLVMMPATNAEEAVAALDRLRESLRQAAPAAGVPLGVALSFSAGVAVCESAADLEPAIERADAAMYTAKQAGRDRVHGPAALRQAGCATLAAADA